MDTKEALDAAAVKASMFLALLRRWTVFEDDYDEEEIPLALLQVLDALTEPGSGRQSLPYIKTSACRALGFLKAAATQVFDARIGDPEKHDEIELAQGAYLRAFASIEALVEHERVLAEPKCSITALQDALVEVSGAFQLVLYFFDELGAPFRLRSPGHIIDQNFELALRLESGSSQELSSHCTFWVNQLSRISFSQACLWRKRYRELADPVTGAVSRALETAHLRMLNWKERLSEEC